MGLDGRRPKTEVVRRASRGGRKSRVGGKLWGSPVL